MDPIEKLQIQLLGIKTDLNQLTDRVDKATTHLQDLDSRINSIKADLDSIHQCCKGLKRKTCDTPDTDTTTTDVDTQPLTQEEGTKDKGTMTEIVEDLVELGKDVVKHFVAS